MEAFLEVGQHSSQHVHSFKPFQIPDAKSRLIGKDPNAGKDRRQEEKGAAEDGWHHRLDSYESEQAPGDGEGQGSV